MIKNISKKIKAIHVLIRDIKIEKNAKKLSHNRIMRKLYYECDYENNKNCKKTSCICNCAEIGNKYGLCVMTHDIENARKGAKQINNSWEYHDEVIRIYKEYIKKLVFNKTRN